MSFASAQPQINAAQAEGRRIYIGNLNYDLQNADVEQMLASSGFPVYETIKIPLDQASGRNRGYCFVDFATREEADRAVGELQAIMAGREIKVRACEPKQQQDRNQQQGGYNNYNNGGYNNNPYGSPNPGFNGGQRWGNNGYNNRGGFDQGMGDYGQMQQGEMRKLYVGGLGPNPDPAQNEEEIRQLFGGFNPTYISKRLESQRATPENPNYKFCFVEFETAEEANAAKDAIDGRVYGPEGVQLRVSFAKPSRPQQQSPIQQQQQRGGWGRQQQQQQPMDGYNRGPQQSNMAGGWRRG